MKINHTVALNIASVHFTTSFVIGVLMFMYFSGTAISDSYEPDPIWIIVSEKSLWILQPAVCAFGALAAHWKNGTNPLVVLTLGALWSLAFGYMLSWIIQAQKNVK